MSRDKAVIGVPVHNHAEIGAPGLVVPEDFDRPCVRGRYAVGAAQNPWLVRANAFDDGPRVLVEADMLYRVSVHCAYLIGGDLQRYAGVAVFASDVLVPRLARILFVERRQFFI